MSKRISISDLLDAHQTGRRFAVVSCYDYTTAKLVAEAGIEVLLVGDSAAQVILGHDSTLPITMDFMVAITDAVRRAAPEACLVADMPFLSYHTSVADAVKNAGRFFQEAGAQVVKIECTAAHLDIIRAVSDAGMAVMAHIGIRPQRVAKLGRLRAEGVTAEHAIELIELARKCVDAGADMLLVEGTAREVAAVITKESPVPVISCGSGPDCDAQVLIISDILGLSSAPKPKFAKSFAQLDAIIHGALRDYASQVRSGQFPADELCYHMKPGQLEALNRMLGQ
ncbi:MAG: 3-methyl-2-oxobutanoate hydroxymethyltransferase [Planctomycetaceae bacterium]|nr:3-methyl-2-oxobutanoate hydroxymethyltransferase [Planctomycetaceae bacterium]